MPLVAESADRQCRLISLDRTNAFCDTVEARKVQWLKIEHLCIRKNWVFFDFFHFFLLLFDFRVFNGHPNKLHFSVNCNCTGIALFELLLYSIIMDSSHSRWPTTWLSTETYVTHTKMICCLSQNWRKLFICWLDIRSIFLTNASIQ